MLTIIGHVVNTLRRNIRILRASSEFNGWVMRLNTDLSVKIGDDFTDFTAFIDTGNRLHEPLSGLPVLIVASRVWNRFFPCGCEHVVMRSVPFYSVTGERSTMRVFKPEGIFLVEDGKRYDAPDVWVGAVDELPGGFDGLASAEFGMARSMIARSKPVTKLLRDDNNS